MNINNTQYHTGIIYRSLSTLMHLHIHGCMLMVNKRLMLSSLHLCVSTCNHFTLYVFLISIELMTVSNTKTGIPGFCRCNKYSEE